MFINNKNELFFCFGMKCKKENAFSQNVYFIFLFLREACGTSFQNKSPPCAKQAVCAADVIVQQILNNVYLVNHHPFSYLVLLT